MQFSHITSFVELVLSAMMLSTLNLVVPSLRIGCLWSDFVKTFGFTSKVKETACSVCSKVWCLLLKVALKVKPNLGGRILFLFPKVHSSKDLPSLFGLFWVAVTCSGVCFRCDSWKCKRISGEKQTNRTASSDAVCSFKSKYLVFPFEATLTGLSRWI